MNPMPFMTRLDRFAGRLIEILCAALISAGVLLAFFKTMPDVFAWAFIVMPAVFALFWGLAFRLRFVILLLASVLAGLIFNWRAYDAVKDFVYMCARFFTWWLAMKMPGGYEFGAGANLAAHWISALAVVFVVWLVIRFVRSMALMAVLAAAAIMVIASYGFGGNYASVLLIAAGVIPLAARPARRARKKLGGARAFPASAAMLMALPAVLVCVACGALTAKMDAASLRNAGLSDKLAEISDQIQYTYRFITTGQYGVGWVDQDPAFTGRLGGPNNGTGNTLIMTVKTDTPYLMKGNTYDYYDGHGWRNTVTDASGFYPSMYSDYAPVAGDSPPDGFWPYFSVSANRLPPPDTTGMPLSAFVRDASADVTMYFPSGLQIYDFGDIQKFSSDAGIVPHVQNDSSLLSDKPLKSGFSYSFSSLILDREQPGFDAFVNSCQLTIQLVDGSWRIDALALPNGRPGGGRQARRTSPAYTNLADYSRYTQLPFNRASPRRDMMVTAFMANAVTAGAPNFYDKAVILENWLKTSFSYTLNPAEPPPDRDFVAYFLETKEGYCVYYATAMAVMARMIGIPSRYVTGYGLVPDGAGRYKATTGTAHAWVELYFEGVGWVTFDPTGGANNYSNVGIEPDAAAATTPSAPPAATPAPSSAAPSPAPSAPGQTAAGADGVRSVFSTIALIALAATAVCAVLAGLLIWRGRNGLRDALAPRDSGEALERIFRDVRAMFAALGCGQLASETILSYAGRVSDALGLEGDSRGRLRGAAGAVCALRYGGHAPSPDDLASAAELRARLDKLSRARLGAVRHRIMKLAAFAGNLAAGIRKLI